MSGPELMRLLGGALLVAGLSWVGAAPAAGDLLKTGSSSGPSSWSALPTWQEPPPPDTVVPSPAPPVTPPGPAPRDTVAAFLVRTRSRAPATALSVTFPSGSGNDPEGGSGASALLVRALESEVRRRLSGDMALVSGEATPGMIRFTLVVPSDGAAGAWSTVREVLFETPVPEAAVEAARGQLLGPLRFERGAPVRLFELEFDRLLLGVTHPWARPAQGTEQDMTGLTVEGIRELQRVRLRLPEARVAVVGPVDPDSTRNWIAGRAAPSARSAPTAGDGAPDGGVRTVLERDVVNAWVAMAWPSHGEHSRTELEFAAHVLRERLAPGLPDPGLFSVTVRVEELPAGPALRIVAAVDPGQVGSWEGRILGAVRSLVEAPPPDDFLALYRRRFAGETLLGESLPEVEAARLGRDLLLLGEGRDLAAELQELDGDRVQQVIRSLGEPRILVYGPAEASAGL